MASTATSKASPRAGPTCTRGASGPVDRRLGPSRRRLPHRRAHQPRGDPPRGERRPPEHGDRRVHAPRAVHRGRGARRPLRRSRPRDRDARARRVPGGHPARRRHRLVPPLAPRGRDVLDPHRAALARGQPPAPVRRGRGRAPRRERRRRAGRPLERGALHAALRRGGHRRDHGARRRGRLLPPARRGSALTRDAADGFPGAPPAPAAPAGAPPRGQSSAMSGAQTITPPRPQRVGSYELIESFLTSGPSTFYRAKNLILGNPVIVRRLTLDPASPDDAREPFFREMRHAASLDHRAISRPSDVLEQDGYLWSVHSPRMTAPSTQRVESSGPLSLAEAARAGADVADALAHLHSKGFVYGRVAPAWISLDEQGASLFAFTKSADLAGGIWPLREKVAAWSPFTAPEELAGGRPNADGDLYGLAGTLFWWLTRRYPAGGADATEAMARVRAGAPRESLRTARRDVPEPLAAAIDAALEPDPAARRGNVAALGTLLDETYHRELAETPSGFSVGAILRPGPCPQGVAIEGRHGSGAFGVVFRARAVGEGTPLAVKALKPEHRDDADARERFLREARALESIHHDNVVRMYAVGEERGTPYAIMDFVAGPDLATLLLREGALAPPRAIHLAIG